MSAIRVLIVDDSVVARRLITNVLSRHPELSVVGTAATGTIALAKLPQLTPDIVILDMDMPEMDGITTLKYIRALYPRLPVIMFSSFLERGSKGANDALARGANDCVAKPSGTSNETLDDVVNGVLVPKIIALGRKAAAGASQVAPQPNAFASSPPTSQIVASVTRSRPPPKLALSTVKLTPQVIGIASSTGGPNALAELIPALPADLSVPVLIVQHMPPIFTRCLAERLDGRTSLTVLESRGGERLLPGHIYVAPGNFHLEVVREADGVYTRLSSEVPENSCRPAADVLFRSLARVYGPSVLAVVLTGMGQDGALGAREIVQAGGRVLAQSGPTCVVWGMPRAVEEAGLCEAVVPLAEMASAIAQRTSPSRVVPRAAQGGG